MWSLITNKMRYRHESDGTRLEYLDGSTWKFLYFDHNFLTQSSARSTAIRCARNQRIDKPAKP